MTDVLVVDDLLAMRELLLLALDLMGYDVAAAGDGAATLAYLRQTSRHTIVLLDSLLPDTDGIELLEAVARDPRLAYWHAYLLMVDQHDALPDHANAVLSALGVPLLFKPFDLDALFESIAQLCARLRTTRATSAYDARGTASSRPHLHRPPPSLPSARLRPACRGVDQALGRRRLRCRAHPPS